MVRGFSRMERASLTNEHSSLKVNENPEMPYSRGEKKILFAPTFTSTLLSENSEVFTSASASARIISTVSSRPVQYACTRHLHAKKERTIRFLLVHQGSNSQILCQTIQTPSFIEVSSIKAGYSGKRNKIPKKKEPAQTTCHSLAHNPNGYLRGSCSDLVQTLSKGDGIGDATLGPRPLDAAPLPWQETAHGPHVLALKLESATLS